MSSIPIPEENELHPSLLSKGSGDVLISSQFDLLLFKEEYNSELEELVFQLAKYKREVNESINEGYKKPQKESIDNALFTSIENMLLQASYIGSDQKRHDYIHRLYNWYKEKSGHFVLMPTIDRDKHKDALTTKPHIIEEDNRQSYNDNEERHRTKKIKSTDLKQYRIKKINMKRIEAIKAQKGEYKKEVKLEEQQQQQQGNSKPKEKEKERDLFELTKGSFKSTFYTSLKGKNYYATSDKLRKLNLQEILKDTKDKDKGIDKDKDKILQYSSSAFNIPIQENKSSYSILRPPFKSDLLILEKQIQKQKNKELQNKRTTEEIRTMAQMFGLCRAKYNESMNKKYELKKMLQRNYSNASMTSNSNSRVMKTKTISDSLILSSKTSVAIEEGAKSLMRQRNKRRKKKEVSKTIMETKLKDKDKDYASKSTIRHYSSYKKQHDDNDDTSRNKTKISLDNIKNSWIMEYNGYSNRDKVSSEKAIDLKMRLSALEGKMNLIQSYKKEEDELPNDCVSREIFLNPIYRTRNMNKSLIDIREIDNQKEGYLSLNNDPMSLLDMSHIESYRNKEMNNDKEKEKGYPLNSLDYAKSSFKHLNHNYLLLRKTLANKRAEELSSLNNSINSSLNKIKHNNKKPLNKSALYQAYMNPLDEHSYPTTYLPNSASGLLITPYIS